jgi:hypothetical protein
VDVAVTNGDDLACPECGEEPYLQASLPTPDGYAPMVLCPRCHARVPAAKPLLAWFAAHPTVTDEVFDEFAGLVRRWLEEVTPPTVSDQALRDALTQWAR